MNSISDEIKEFDRNLSGKNNEEIEKILEKESIELKRVMQDGEPDFINIINGYIEVVKYSDFTKELPNLCRYELYNYERTK